LSYYNFVRKYRHIDDSYPLDRYVDDFVSGRLNSADWGTWAENVGTWISARANDPKFLLLRYEDMIENPARNLARIAEFLGVKADQERLENVIERSSAQRMRELEQKQGDGWVSTRNHRKDIPFVGAASSGGWKSKLPAPSVARIESEWGTLMQFLDYELVTEEGRRRCSDHGSWWTPKSTAEDRASALSRSGQ
jgi:hypothetical protein